MRQRRQGYPSTGRRGLAAALATAALVTALLPGAATAQAPDSAAFAAAARRAVAEQPGPVGPGPVAGRVTVAPLYARTGHRPLWTMRGRPTGQALAVVAALGSAEVRGLRPADYDAPALRDAVAALRQGPVASPETLASFDVDLSRAVLRFLAHLHAGRVTASAVRFHLPDAHGELDLSALALAVSRATDVTATLASAEPPYPGYARLVQTLAHYRRLAADPGLRLPPPPAGARALRPGARREDVPALRRLLGALGDLPSGAAEAGADADRYDEALVAAVVVFQRRHGLEPDGVVGPATLAQLRVPLDQRVRQIDLTLERWRWLPDRPPPRLVVVNIPAFRLTAVEEDGSGRRVGLRTNVIVGQAGRSGTPIFVGTMREVVFRPYWDVPPSIAVDELIPRIRRDHAYFERERLEIVRGGDDDAVLYPLTSANLQRVAAGTLRLRQRPGPDNSLGLVKFLFPNSYNVYLHGTPAQELFARTRRDFSHGCIRVEEPAALAEFVLAGQDGWNPTTIGEAMQGTSTRRVALARPVTVYVLYATVVVGEDGTVQFHPDLYGHDAALARAIGP